MHKLSPKVVDQIFNLRHSGKTYEQVSNDLGISGAIARRYFNPEARRVYEAYQLTHKGNSKVHKDRVKLEVLKHYGAGNAACIQCGEARLACLSIDHINGRGNEHRQRINRRGMVSIVG